MYVFIAYLASAAIWTARHSSLWDWRCAHWAPSHLQRWHVIWPARWSDWWSLPTRIYARRQRCVRFVSYVAFPNWWRSSCRRHVRCSARRIMVSARLDNINYIYVYVCIYLIFLARHTHNRCNAYYGNVREQFGYVDAFQKGKFPAR